MFQEETFSTATAELVLEMQSRNELYTPILNLLESRQPKEVLTGAVQLSELKQNAVTMVEQVGFHSEDAQQFLLSLLIANHLDEKYAQKIKTAHRLEYTFIEGQFFNVAVFLDIAENLLLSHVDFDISPQEIFEKLTDWFGRTTISLEIISCKNEVELEKVLALVTQLLELETVPLEIKRDISGALEYGKTELIQSILNENSSQRPEDSVSIAGTRKLYQTTISRQRMLYLLGCEADTVNTFTQSAITAVNSRDVKRALLVNPMQVELQTIIQELAWVTGSGKVLNAEVERLGLTPEKYVRVFAASLNRLSTAMHLVDISKQLGFFTPSEYRGVLEIYLQMLGKDIFGETKTGIAVTCASEKLDAEQLDLLRALTREVGIDWEDDAVQQALTQNNNFRFVSVLK